MEKLLILIFTLLTGFAKGQTSVYHSFPDSNAAWNFHFESYCFSKGKGDENYSIILSGDTIINSKTYHKLTTPYVKSFSTGTCGGKTTGYKGAIREEKAIKKVFYVSTTDTIEKLLYDFNMNVGDTVKGYIQSFSLPTADIVISIDSVLVGSTYRKRWKINSDYNIQIIEGIGSTYGLFEHSPGSVTDLPDYSLICFQQNGQSLYPNATANCQHITPVYTIDKFSNHINVFPNPSTGYFIIDFNNSEIKEIKLSDLNGNVVLQKKTNKQTQTKIENIKNGTYILTIIDSANRTINRKLKICP